MMPPCTPQSSLGRPPLMRGSCRVAGDLPTQREGDAIDVRAFLHRDGSVVSAVSVEDLSRPDRLYYNLGCKTAVGMPFKDIATSDSIFSRKAPAVDAKDARTALRRLQESGLGVLFPAAELEKNPVPNAVAVMRLKDVKVRVRLSCAHGVAPLRQPRIVGGRTFTGGGVVIVVLVWGVCMQGKVTLPAGAIRYVISLEGDETDAELEQLKTLSPVFLLLSIKPEVSRVHASRRIMDFVVGSQMTTPVIHHVISAAKTKDELILRSGSEVCIGRAPLT
jgi:(E)-4-hydroxy-3-methylbut-2-enyl-diphosphate synthase